MGIDVFQLPMPGSHTFTCTILTNNTRQGLLHIILRHYPEFETMVPGLTEILNQLPASMQAVMGCIAEGSVHCTTFEQLQKSCTEDVTQLLLEAQKKVHRFLMESVANYICVPGANTAGQYQLRLALKNGLKLVLAPSRNVLAPEATTIDERPLRMLITAFIR